MATYEVKYVVMENENTDERQNLDVRSMDFFQKLAELRLKGFVPVREF